MKFTQNHTGRTDIGFGSPLGREESLAALFGVATDALHDGLILCDQTGKIIWINSSARKTCRLEWSSCTGKTIASLVDDSTFPTDGIAEAFANSASMIYVEEAHQGSNYVVDIKRTMEPNTTKIYYVICIKNVKVLLKIAKSEDPAKNLSGSLAGRQETHKNGRQNILDDRLEKLINLGVKACAFGSRILITGESGVGKSQYARTLDKRVNRAGKSFVHLNCASIPETLFESELFGYEAGSFTGASVKGKKGLVEIAEKGALFLDEVGEIPVSCQSKILRFLDDGSYMKVGGTKPRKADVQIISATNRDLRKMVDEGKFRADLYFRLQAVEVLIPPLRERRALIDTLILGYLEFVKEEHGQDITITKRCRQFLGTYRFPGNIRELENALQHMAILCDGVMDMEHLPVSALEAAKKENVASDDFIGEPRKTQPDDLVEPTSEAPAEEAGTLKEIVKQFEHELVIKAIHQQGSKRKAAKALGVDIATIVRKSRV